MRLSTKPIGRLVASIAILGTAILLANPIHSHAGGTGGGGNPSQLDSYESTWQSIFESMIARSAQGDQVPNAVFLDQNFPNPFNPSTRIRYGLPQSTRVRITVYTLVGRPIATLVDAQQEAGVYTVEFTAQEVPSGVYFYRLQTDIGSVTRRLTISK